jgi:GTPase SAR1 family protein
MGACGSKQSELSEEEVQRQRNEAIRNKWLDDMLSKDRQQDNEVVKLLFLGTGESGKSTLLKQMAIIHGQGFNVKDRDDYKAQVRTNLLQNIRLLIQNAPKIAQETKDPSCNIQSAAAQTAATHLAQIRFDSEIVPQLADDIKTVWHDPGIQKTCKFGNLFSLPDSTHYFFERIDNIVRKDYLPDNDDILHARVRTTGIVEMRFEIDNNLFHMFDVGGQRSARRKWIHCFEGVTAVVYVAACSEYDQSLYEDVRSNRMHESLNVFEDVCESKYFNNLSIIVFLNKKDIFKEKIKHTSLRVCFPQYEGKDKYGPGLAFIRAQYKERNRNPNRELYVHFTCAVDTGNIRKVFNDVKHTLIKMHLLSVNLIGTSGTSSARVAPNQLV